MKRVIQKQGKHEKDLYTRRRLYCRARKQMKNVIQEIDIILQATICRLRKPMQQITDYIVKLAENRKLNNKGNIHVNSCR